MIWECVDDDALVDEAMTIAKQLRDGPTKTYKEVRQAFAHAENASMAEQLEYERQKQQVLTDTPNFLEGIMAFVEKRKPEFSSD